MRQRPLYVYYTIRSGFVKWQGRSKNLNRESQGAVYPLAFPFLERGWFNWMDNP